MGHLFACFPEDPDYDASPIWRMLEAKGNGSIIHLQVVDGVVQGEIQMPLPYERVCKNFRVLSTQAPLYLSEM